MCQFVVVNHFKVTYCESTYCEVVCLVWLIEQNDLLRSEFSILFEQSFIEFTPSLKSAVFVLGAWNFYSNNLEFKNFVKSLNFLFETSNILLILAHFSNVWDISLKI